MRAIAAHNGNFSASRNLEFPKDICQTVNSLGQKGPVIPLPLKLHDPGLSIDLAVAAHDLTKTQLAHILYCPTVAITGP